MLNKILTLLFVGAVIGLVIYFLKFRNFKKHLLLGVFGAIFAGFTMEMFTVFMKDINNTPLLGAVTGSFVASHMS